MWKTPGIFAAFRGAETIACVEADIRFGRANQFFFYIGAFTGSNVGPWIGPEDNGTSSMLVRRAGSGDYYFQNLIQVDADFTIVAVCSRFAICSSVHRSAISFEHRRLKSPNNER